MARAPVGWARRRIVDERESAAVGDAARFGCMDVVAIAIAGPLLAWREVWLQYNRDMGGGLAYDRTIAWGACWLLPKRIDQRAVEEVEQREENG